MRYELVWYTHEGVRKGVIQAFNSLEYIKRRTPSARWLSTTARLVAIRPVLGGGYIRGVAGKEWHA